MQIQIQMYIKRFLRITDLEDCAALAELCAFWFRNGPGDEAGGRVSEISASVPLCKSQLQNTAAQ